MPPGIDYKSVDISVLAGVSSRADVPREPRVDPDDGVPLTPEGNVVDPWNLSIVTRKVMAFKKWTAGNMLEELEGGDMNKTSTYQKNRSFEAFLKLRDFPNTGVAISETGEVYLNPSLAYQTATFYLPLVQKLKDVITTEMSGDAKLDALSSEC